MEGSEVNQNESDRPIRRNESGRRSSRSARAARGARVRVAAALGILVVWGGATVYDTISSSYNPPEGINTVALAAATYLFGSAFLKESNKR